MKPVSILEKLLLLALSLFTGIDNFIFSLSEDISLFSVDTVKAVYVYGFRYILIVVVLYGIFYPMNWEKKIKLALNPLVFLGVPLLFLVFWVQYSTAEYPSIILIPFR